MKTRKIIALMSGCTTLLLLSATPMANRGDSRVAEAARRGDAAAVRSLLQQGGDVNGAEGDGMTALHWAAKRGDSDLTALLLRSGADPGVATQTGGHTPLHVAA